VSAGDGLARRFAAAAILLVSAAPAAAHLVGGEIEQRAVSDPATELARRDAAVNGAGRRWIAWSVPARNDRTVGCFSGWTRDERTSCACSLAADSKGWGSSDSFPVESGDLEIFAAIRGGKVEQLKVASRSCPVHALGERVTVLERADPARGVALLAALAHDERDEDLSEMALAVIAHHSAKSVPAASAAIADLARESEDGERRGQALFWLSQTDEPRAARWILDAISRDPDAEVREQAVFALSQLPDGADQLLAVIRGDHQNAVKKQALFWLGQSNDPRAFAEIERVLAR
jgi:hypothetical protein